MKNHPISIAYALTWKCYCSCPICLSGFKKKNYLATNISRWKEIAAPVLRNKGSVRLTLTGGDPMRFWDKTDELLEFIKYLHKNEVHVCLNTTGINLTADKLNILDKYLDTVLLSVRGLTVEEVVREFGVEGKDAERLLDTQLMVLHEIQKTNIRLEISTVVTKENYFLIDNLGSELCKINKNIIWRVEEYYKNGKQLKQPEGKFDLESDQYSALLKKLNKKYSNCFYIRSSSKEGRINAPDMIIFPDGVLHSTSDNSYKAICPIEQFDFTKMKTRRDWSSYKNSLRDWSWKRDAQD